VLTVRVELPPAVTDAGLKLAEAPAGTPDAERVTDSAAPAMRAVVTPNLALAPWTAVADAGLAAIEKSFVAGAVTASEMVVEWIAVASVPVTVSV
jgi:hypothetical protein